MMINIEGISDDIKVNVIDFLTNIPSIEKIDETILKNAIIAIEDGKIVGCISFEIFYDKGLIRYFVFKKMLEAVFLERLLLKLENKALIEGVDTLVSIAEGEQIERLFKSLGFNDINESNIFINEENIKNTNFKNSKFLKKCLAN